MENIFENAEYTQRRETCNGKKENTNWKYQNTPHLPNLHNLPPQYQP